MTGFDMWREYILIYGREQARDICNNYLDMQMWVDDPEEIEFCRQLYSAMKTI